MQFPDTQSTRLTEKIMAEIRPHLKLEDPPQENYHYNRTYEAIWRILTAAAPEKGTRPGA
jgi:hypothetical protein